MNIVNTVISEDAERAIKLQRCAIDCITTAKILTSNFKYSQAEKWIVEYHRCTQELKVLQHKKIKSERTVENEKRNESVKVV